MILRRCLAVWATCAATVVGAQTVEDCDWRASAEAIAEPWEFNTRSFANGAVRLALADTLEPAAGALHVVVLYPVAEEDGGYRTCKVVSYDSSMGFAGVLFEDMAASYDPALGLLWVMDVQVFDAVTAELEPRILGISLNQATGAVDAVLE